MTRLKLQSSLLYSGHSWNHWSVLSSTNCCFYTRLSGAYSACCCSKICPLGVCVGGRLTYIFWDFPLCVSVPSRISLLTFQRLCQPQNISSNITSKTVGFPLSGPCTDFWMLWGKRIKLANISWCNSHHLREDSLTVLLAFVRDLYIHKYTHLLYVYYI